MIAKVLEYIKDQNVIVTTSPDQGSTSTILALAEELIKEDRGILYFDPSFSINRQFVEKYYPLVFYNISFLIGPLQTLIYYLDSNPEHIDTIIIDPGDCLMSTSMIYRDLISLSSTLQINIIVTSQIRINPSEGGKPYSTIEKLNKDKLVPSGIYFPISIWLRNVTETSIYYKRKYLDVFDCYREGNKYLKRYLITYGLEGNVIS